MDEQQKIYDELSSVLTDYENDVADGEDLYEILVKIQNNWEGVITSKDN